MRILTFLILLAVMAIANFSQAGTCTSISRVNAGPLSVLTSTTYNAELNAAYAAVNSFDGGCTTIGTLESDALNTTDFAPLLNGIREGCKVEYSNASTVTISKCLASVNGKFVTTTSNTPASFGCAGCSAEVATNSYYVYIQTGSSGSTLTPLILTGAPNGDGYDGTGNKVLGRFYNNASSDIAQHSIDQWKVTGFGTDVVKTPGSSTGRVNMFSLSYGTTNIATNCTGTPCFIDQIGSAVSGVSRSGTGQYALATSRTYLKLKCSGVVSATGVMEAQFSHNIILACDNCNSLIFTTARRDTGVTIDTIGTLLCHGEY